MDNRCKAHIVSQTHWDREWYLNSKYTNEWMVPFFKNLFVMLKKGNQQLPANRLCKNSGGLLISHRSSFLIASRFHF